MNGLPALSTAIFDIYEIVATFGPIYGADADLCRIVTVGTNYAQIFRPVGTGWMVVDIRSLNLPCLNERDRSKAATILVDLLKTEKAAFEAEGRLLLKKEELEKKK